MRYAPVLLLVAALALMSVPVQASPESQVWFSALDPVQRPEVGYGGSPQYMDLFSPNAPWQHAASHVRVFKVYGQWVDQASDVDLRRQFADLKQRGIALGLDAGAMTAPGPCGIGVEGYGGQSLVQMAKRIQQDGGTLSYLAMDELLYFGSIYDGKNACHWTPEQAVAAAVPNLKVLLAAFPDIKVGDIEPVGEPPLETTNDRYRRGIEAFQRALGFPLVFFHADVSWSTPSFSEKLVALHKMVESEHVPFGVIYDGNPNDFSDATWLQSAESHMAEVERAIGTPEHVIFQSWNRYPRKLLPESAPDAFTHLIDSYFHTRTNLTSAVSDHELNGRLTTAQEQPIARAKIQVLLTSLSSSDALGTLAAKGIIPPGTTGILFGIRVNTECGCSGPADLRIAEFRLQPKNGPSIVNAFQNPRSATGWGGMTDTKGARLGGVQNGVLHLAVRRGQEVAINSAKMPEHGQGDFRFSVKAHLTPASTGSGYFAVLFMHAGTELSRAMIRFAPASIPIGAARTGRDGSWSIRLPEQSGDAFTVQAQYEGDERYWPAQSSATERRDSKGPGF
jgi:hypothetical protein